MKQKQLLRTLLAAVCLFVGTNAWATTGVDVWDFSDTNIWGNYTSKGRSSNYKELATGSEVWFAADGSSATSATSNVSFNFVADGARFNYGGDNRLGISSTGNYDSTNDINYVKVVIPDGYKVLVDMSVGSSGRPMHVDLDGSVTNYTSNSVYTYTNSTGSSKTIKVYGSNGANNDYKNHHINSITLLNTATAPRYGWTANAKATIGGDLTTIKTYTSSSDVLQTDNYTVVVDKVIKYNGEYYSLNDPAFATNIYGVTHTMGTSAAIYNFNYEKIENCAFYGEAESICTAQSNGYTKNNSTVLSNGGGKYVQKDGTGYVTLTFNVEKAGYYDIKLGLNNTNDKSRGFNYQIDGGTESETITIAANTAQIQEINDQYLTAGDHTLKLNLTYMLTPEFDYVLVTSDYEFTEVIGATDKTSPAGTKSSDYTMKKGDTKVFTFRNYGSATSNANFGYNWRILVTEGSTLKSTTRCDFFDEKGNYHLDFNLTDGSDDWNLMSTDGGVTKTGLNWGNYASDLANATVVATLAYGTDGKLTIDAVSTGDNPGYKYYVHNEISDLTNDITINLSVDHAWLGVLSVEQTAVGVTTTGDGKGWATLYTDKGLDFSNVDGLTAYTATIDNSTVTLNKVDDIQANTGVVLKSSTEDANTTYSIPVFASSSTDSGALLGSVTEAKEATTENPIYILKLNTNYEAQFKRATTGSLAAGKAYLVIGNGQAKALSVMFANDPTGIATVNAAEVAQPVKRIVNGQLVIEKNGKRYNAAGAEF